MAREEITQVKVQRRLTSKVAGWSAGDGATTEFELPRAVDALDRLLVFVDGALKRPADGATAYDYKVRGISQGYDGDKTMVQFTAAPAAGKNILLQLL